MLNMNNTTVHSHKRVSCRLGDMYLGSVRRYTSLGEITSPFDLKYAPTQSLVEVALSERLVVMLHIRKSIPSGL